MVSQHATAILHEQTKEKTAEQLAFLKAFINNNKQQNPLLYQDNTPIINPTKKEAAKDIAQKRWHDRNQVIDHICQIVKNLIKECDYCIFTHYDSNISDDEPQNFVCLNRFDHNLNDMPVHFNFEGIGVWYIAWRDGEIFRARKLLVVMQNGHYTNGMVGDFEGYWKDFAHYVTEDKWIERCLLYNRKKQIKSSFAANDQ